MPPLLNAVISGYVAGDDLTIIENVTSIPVGRSMVKAWLTIKAAREDSDPGVIQKVITTVAVAGVGQITDDGAGDQIGQLTFILTATDTGTTLTVGKAYYFDEQIKFDDGSIATLKIGKISFELGVTAATT